jgi:hypothetical protein
MLIMNFEKEDDRLKAIRLAMKNGKFIRQMY